VSSWRVGRVELLAAGKQSAIFGVHPDTQRPFVWPQRSILEAEKHDIPFVNAVQLEVLRHHLREAFEGIPQECKSPKTSSSDYPSIGERNDTLFRKGCVIAHDVGSEEDLLTILLGLNSEFIKPLDRKEVRQIVSSVWGYKQRGTLWKSGKDTKIVMPVTREGGGEIFKKLGPITCKLYLTLLATRYSKKEFSIPQKATAEQLGCSVQSISDALKELKQCGLIIDEGKKRGGSSNWRAAKLYRFGSGEGLHTV
jgi:biotin operon repressor